MLNSPFNECPTQDRTPAFIKGFPGNSLWILLFASMSFLKPDPEKVFYSMSLFVAGGWVPEEQVQHCLHGPNHLLLELVKNVLGIAEIRF